MPKRSLAALALGALAAGSLAAGAPARAASAQADNSGLGIRLLDAPTSRRDDPRAHAFIVDHVTPGSTFERHVEVSNDTGRAARILLYPAAATIDGGAFRVGDGHAANELTEWIKLDPASVSLADGGRASVTVTVTVPPTASASERYAAVLAELPASQAPPGGVALASRVGVRVYLSVGPGGEPASDFTITSLAAARDKDGRPLVRAKVANTGGRALDLSGELTLKNADRGFSFGPFPAKLGTTLGIGESADVTVLLDPQIPAVPYDARIALRSGRTEREAKARIEFPAGANASASPVPATEIKPPGYNLAVAIALGLVVLLLAGLLILLLIRRRSRRAEPQVA